MIKQIVELCNAKYFIPFANFNELRAKQHEQLVEFQIKNTPKTVKDYFKNSDVQVLDLIPGDIWNGEDNHVIRKNKIDRLFERKNIHFSYACPLCRKWSRTRAGSFTGTVWYHVVLNLSQRIKIGEDSKSQDP